MSPEEELDRARAREAWRLWNEEGGITDDGHCVIAARLAREGWVPTPKPSPRVMAMREWHLTQYTHPDHHTKITRGAWDQADQAKAFLAGYAAAVKVAEPLVEYLRDAAAGFHGDTPNKHLTTYLTAIGEETP